MLAVLLAAAPPAGAQDHLVDSVARDARLFEQAAQRAHRRLALQSWLAGTDAERAAGLLGLSSSAPLASRISQLGDEELQDLARRVEQLQHDPAAGNGDTAITIAVVILIVLLVTSLVLEAAGHSAR